MLERTAHWIGISHWWLAEWVQDSIVAYGPFRKEEAHRYTVTCIMRSIEVALAYNEFELPLFTLLANLKFPSER